jgi:hypothetical protein
MTYQFERRQRDLSGNNYQGDCKRLLIIQATGETLS